jgi:CheY-like chemotaxis protein
VFTRHIPVCVISTDESRERALNAGAMAFVAKPIQTKEKVDELLAELKDFTSRDTRSLLVVESDPSRRDQIVAFLGADDLQVTAVADAAEAVQTLQERRMDCVVVNPVVPASGPEGIVKEVRWESGIRQLPVIVYAEKEGDHGTNGGWDRLAGDCTVRRVQSPERLLDQASLFLHRKVDKLSPAQQRLLIDLHSSEKVLPGKRVLIVDDDIRNIFALSTVLEERDMEIVSAGSGREAINILRNDDAIDIVLMDIMMPDMDGIDTMREIRKIPSLKSLPIIAVTAKAMKGDREKCIEAGAWDYLSKPVDTEQMLAVLRAWLHR